MPHEEGRSAPVEGHAVSTDRSKSECRPLRRPCAVRGRPGAPRRHDKNARMRSGRSVPKMRPGLWRKLGEQGLREVAYRGGGRDLAGGDGRARASAMARRGSSGPGAARSSCGGASASGPSASGSRAGRRLAVSRSRPSLPSSAPMIERRRRSTLPPRWLGAMVAVGAVGTAIAQGRAGTGGARPSWVGLPPGASSPPTSLTVRRTTRSSRPGWSGCRHPGRGPAAA